MSDTVVIGSTKPNPVQLPVPGSLLTKWNGAMALFHGALTVVTLAVGNLDLRVPVYASEISLDVGDSNSTSEWRLVPGVATRSGWMYLTYLTASFFFLSCVFHTGNVLLWRAPYQRALAGGFAPFRWAEYSLSASVLKTTSEGSSARKGGQGAALLRVGHGADPYPADTAKPSRHSEDPAQCYATQRDHHPRLTESTRDLTL